MVDGAYTFIFKKAIKKEIVKKKQKGLSELIETVQNWRKVVASMKA